MVAFAVAIAGGLVETDATGWDLIAPTLGLALVVALIARTPFVGLLVSDDIVHKRGWARTRTVPVSLVRRVDVEPYSGWWNRGGRSGLFVMVVLYLHDDSRIEVPELMARPKRGAVLAARVKAALSLDPEASVASGAIAVAQSSKRSVAPPSSRHRAASPRRSGS